MEIKTPGWYYKSTLNYKVNEVSLYATFKNLIMKNKAGKISGFILGIVGFLIMFKIVFLDNIPPEDELAPGIVVLASVLDGLLFAYIGSLIQNYILKKGRT